MSYKLKLESIKTVKELFDFRDELEIDADKYSSVYDKNNSNADLKKCQEANFYIQRVIAQIIYLENRGVFLNNIEIKKEEETKEEVLQLLSKHIKNGNKEI